MINLNSKTSKLTFKHANYMILIIKELQVIYLKPFWTHFFLLVFSFQFYLLISIWLKIKYHGLFCLFFIRLSRSHERILLYLSLQRTIHWNRALLCFFYLFFPFQLIFLKIYSLILNYFLFSYHIFIIRPCSQTHI
jgi:hypothetical protein